MITIGQIGYIHMSWTREHGVMTIEIPTLSVISEDNGQHMNMVYGSGGMGCLIYWLNIINNTFAQFVILNILINPK